MRIRIFHGPVTIGGIGWHLATWQRQQGLSSDCIVYDDRGQRQLYHVNLMVSRHGKFHCVFLMLVTFLFALFHYDLFHFYGGQTFLPFNIDLPILRLFGKKIVMTYCGSEIRLVQVAEKRNPFMHLLPARPHHRKHDKWKRLRMRWQNLWINRFTAIRNLYDHAIEVLPPKKVWNWPWLNNIGFMTSASPDPSTLTTSSEPLLVHAPSNRRVKGSEYVERAIEELRRRGVSFRYKELHGVPNREVQGIIRKCDIVVDQFLIGGIGTLAFEGMGYGKPVVGYLSEEVVKKHMPDCPVYSATIDNLADRLQELINAPKLRLDLGRKGIEFCKKHLDYETIQKGVVELYQEIWDD